MRNDVLLNAVRRGNTEDALALIKNGVSLDSVDQFFQTALHLAAKLGNKQVVEALLESDADTEAVDNEKRTPIVVAAEFRRWDIVRIFAKNFPTTWDNAERALFYCARYQAGQQAAIDLIRAGVSLEADMDLSLQNSDGDTLIVIIAKQGYWEGVTAVAQFFSSMTENPDPKGSGQALLLAAKANETQTVITLFAAKSPIILDKSNLSAAHFAIRNKNPQILSIVLALCNPEVGIYIPKFFISTTARFPEEFESLLASIHEIRIQIFRGFESDLQASRTLKVFPSMDSQISALEKIEMDLAMILSYYEGKCARNLSRDALVYEALISIKYGFSCLAHGIGGYESVINKILIECAAYSQIDHHTAFTLGFFGKSSHLAVRLTEVAGARPITRRKALALAAADETKKSGMKKLAEAATVATQACD